MLFSKIRFRGAGEGPARDTLRALWPTTATPPLFAVPLDVVEDDEGYTLLFDVAGHAASDVVVRAEGNAICIEVEPRRRTFWLGAAIEADRVEAEFGTDELRVRVIKTRVAAARKIVVRRGP